MVEWGFDYQSLKNMPVDEFYDYIKLLNETSERRAKEAKGKPQDQADDQPNPIGKVVPNNIQ